MEPEDFNSLVEDFSKKYRVRTRSNRSDVSDLDLEEIFRAGVEREVLKLQINVPPAVQLQQDGEKISATFQCFFCFEFKALTVAKNKSNNQPPKN